MTPARATLATSKRLGSSPFTGFLLVFDAPLLFIALASQARMIAQVSRIARTIASIYAGSITMRSMSGQTPSRNAADRSTGVRLLSSCSIRGVAYTKRYAYSTGRTARRLPVSTFVVPLVESMPKAVVESQPATARILRQISSDVAPARMRPVCFCHDNAGSLVSPPGDSLLTLTIIPPRGAKCLRLEWVVPARGQRSTRSNGLSVLRVMLCLASIARDHLK